MAGAQRAVLWPRPRAKKRKKTSPRTVRRFTITTSSKPSRPGSCSSGPRSRRSARAAPTCATVSPASKTEKIWLYNVHINPYSHRGYSSHEPTRKRKLLLHRREIRKLIGKTVEKGLTLVPTRLYFQNGHVKVALALAKGKQAHDKRETIKEARGRPRNASRGQGTAAVIN